MSKEQLETINENNMKVESVLKVVIEALTGDLDADVVSMVDIALDYTKRTDDIVASLV